LEDIQQRRCVLLVEDGEPRFLHRFTHSASGPSKPKRRG
jgi:hypothetical protein